MTINYDGKAVVAVYESLVPQEQFDDKLTIAHEILSCFPAQQRNTWGTDGVGYHVNKKFGLVSVKLSKVGPRVFRRTLATVAQRFPELNVEPT